MDAVGDNALLCGGAIVRHNAVALVVAHRAMHWDLISEREKAGLFAVSRGSATSTIFKRRPADLCSGPYNIGVRSLAQLLGFFLSAVDGPLHNGLLMLRGVAPCS